MGGIDSQYALVSGSPACTPQFPGNSGALDQACLLNEANSPLCGAISYVKTSLLFPAPGAIQYFFPRIGLLQIVKSTELFTSHIASSVKLNDNLS